MRGRTCASTCFALSGSGAAFSARGREFLRGGLVTHTVLRYVQSQMTQMAQTAVCNRHHSLERQLCRWLLQVDCPQHQTPTHLRRYGR